MKTILIPIKPCFVDEILLGNKKYEYRKIKPKYKIDKMIIYSTSPVMKIVGEVDVLDIIVDTPNKLWNLTKQYSGIKEDFYFKYYHGKDMAVAYKLGKVTKYKKYKDLKELGINYIPQSYIYLD